MQYHAILNRAALCLWCDSTHAPTRGQLLGASRCSRHALHFSCVPALSLKFQIHQSAQGMEGTVRAWPHAVDNKWCPGCGKEVGQMAYLHVQSMERVLCQLWVRYLSILCSFRCHVMCGMLLSLWLVSCGPAKLAQATVRLQSHARARHCIMKVALCTFLPGFGNSSRTICLWGFSQPYLGCCRVRYPVRLTVSPCNSNIAALVLVHWKVHGVLKSSHVSEQGAVGVQFFCTWLTCAEGVEEGTAW